MVPFAAFGCAEDEVRIELPPSAFAGFESVVEVGTAAVLDGTLSSDPNGDRLLYRWTIEAEPAGSIAAIDDPARALTAIVPDEVGTYVLGLAVSDGAFTSRDLVTLSAEPSSSTAAPALGIDLSPRSCHAELGRLADGPCASNGRIRIAPLLEHPEGLEDELSIAWTFIALPPQVTEGDLGIEAPDGPLGPIAFLPPRPGEYWIEAILESAGAASPRAIATVGVFDDDADRPLASIDAPRAQERGRFILFDGRGSIVPTSTVPFERTWALVADPSSGADPLTDIGTGCPVGECRRLLPSAAGSYVVSLRIGSGVAAVAAVEVTDP